MAIKEAKKSPITKAQNSKNTEGGLPNENVIFIKGARANNLKNIDLKIPKNKLVVVTGVSGSGKSSITMDTLFAEGQRRYVESLSSYARQFLMRMKKPDVDYIKGICPAIAIEQKVSSGNNRSTVGSMTEVYDFLRLLYARIGKTYSPVSGDVVKRHQVSDVIDFILNQNENERVQLFIPLPTKYDDRTLEAELNLLLQKGYTRLWLQGNLTQIEDVLKEDFDLRVSGFDATSNIPNPKSATVNTFKDSDIRILIDRFVVKKEDEENAKRMADSVQTAFYESEGEAIVEIIGGETRAFNNRFELDGILFLDPTPQLFNYNNSFGACPVCEGYGKTMGIDEEKVIPNQALSVFEGAIGKVKNRVNGRKHF
jgi:excinuclease ABC subunit A